MREALCTVHNNWLTVFELAIPKHFPIINHKLKHSLNKQGAHHCEWEPLKWQDILCTVKLSAILAEKCSIFNFEFTPQPFNPNLLNITSSKKQTHSAPQLIYTTLVTCLCVSTLAIVNIISIFPYITVPANIISTLQLRQPITDSLISCSFATTFHRLQDKSPLPKVWGQTKYRLF